MLYRAFRINESDNVATALTEIPKGERCEIIGEGNLREMETVEDIPVGHKIALCDIKKDESILKYGVVIGRATADIASGSWIHLHVMCSNFDERSSHLDAVTGAPKDIRYE
ncbi:altronate dehydratase [Lachnospiraceae bacterium JC7]|nr:altronate dehydratase [Lachnospiraceae bacterium JC7]